MTLFAPINKKDGQRVSSKSTNKWKYKQQINELNTKNF